MSHADTETDSSVCCTCCSEVNMSALSFHCAVLALLLFSLTYVQPAGCADVQNLDNYKGDTRTTERRDWRLMIQLRPAGNEGWSATIIECRRLTERLDVDAVQHGWFEGPAAAAQEFFSPQSDASGITNKRIAQLGLFLVSPSSSDLTATKWLDAESLMHMEYYDGITQPAPRHHEGCDDSQCDHHDHSSHGGELHGRGFVQNETWTHVVIRNVPHDVESVVAVVNHPSQQRRAHQPLSSPSAMTHRAAFHTLAYDTATTLLMQQRGIVLTTLQQMGRTITSRSITFLASGYTSSQRTLFNTHVASCLSTLRGDDTSLNAAPWPRYFTTLNLYSLFEPSVQSGASRLGGPQHDCSAMTVCGPSSISTNLGCAFGTPVPSRLGCTVSSVLSLASFSPSVDIVVVLVNDDDVGGSAFPLVATISTNSLYMNYQLIHQLNHAVAGLGDEYSYGFTEPNPSSIALPPNCASTNVAPQVDWNYWIGLGQVASAPISGCTFDNLYRPSDACVMRTATATSMCSVCRERLVQQLFLGGNGVAIEQPRCPPSTWEIYVNASSSTTLSINHAFVLNNANVTVVWYMHDGSVISTNVPTVTVSGSTLQAGANIIRAIVTDSSSYVRISRRPSAMNRTLTFTVRLWQSTSPCVADTCTSSSGVVYSYCRACVSGTCTEAVVQPVTYAAAPRRDVEQETSIVTITAAVTAAVGGLVLVVAFLVLLLHRSKKPSLIYDPSVGEQALSTVVMVTSVISLILVVILIVFAVVYVPQAAVFGRGVLVGVIILAVIVYFVAIAKVIAAFYHSPAVAAVCGVLLSIVGIGIFGIGVFGVYIYDNRDTDDVQQSFASLWLDYTASNPDLICDIQMAFQCSGFYHSCTPTSSSYCPTNCAQPNRDYVNSCEAPWKDWVVRNSLKVGIVCLICGFFFAVAAIMDCLHCVRALRAKASARGRRSYRKDERAPVVPITTKEANQFREEFRKADVDKKGTLEGQDLIIFIQDVFGDPPSPQEEQQLLSAGPMTCEDLLRMYFPHYITSHMDPRQLTPEEAEEASDAVELQRLQYAKLDEFMRAAGALSPEKLHLIYQEYAKTHFMVSGRELLDIIRIEAGMHAGTEEALMCSGLSRQELEGLRGAWVAIHPAVIGDLDDDDLDKLFQWTHGSILHSHEHFVRWKDMLDVRKTDIIGWGEFCYPFAQRARLAHAREYLFSVSREVPHEMLSKAQVADEFGPQMVEQCFMIFEDIIPVERVVHHALRLQERD